MQWERKALEWECNEMSEGRKSAGGWGFIEFLFVHWSENRMKNLYKYSRSS